MVTTTSMFESIEIRKAVNGVIVTIRSDDEDSEYVYDTDRKALKFVKDLLDTKVREKVAE
jgi:hypothetical protein